LNGRESGVKPPHSKKGRAEARPYKTETLGAEAEKNRKQIPHPAKTAAVRDDKFCVVK
jgi:hypothetical protein